MKRTPRHPQLVAAFIGSERPIQIVRARTEVFSSPHDAAMKAGAHAKIYTRRLHAGHYLKDGRFRLGMGVLLKRAERRWEHVGPVATGNEVARLWTRYKALTNYMPLMLSGAVWSWIWTAEDYEHRLAVAEAAMALDGFVALVPLVKLQIDPAILEDAVATFARATQVREHVG